MSKPSPSAVIAVDPGRRKCGVAVVGADGRTLERGIVAVEQLPDHVQAWARRYGAGRLVVGDRTAATETVAALQAAGFDPELVDEHRSTEEARRRYFRENPPRGWRRFIPTSLQVPPHPYDDYVAVILAERYLKGV